MNVKLLTQTILAVALPLAAGTHNGLAQNANSGEIKGTVTDATNAVIPNAAVTILNVQTGISILSKTNGSGIYDVPSVEPGQYRITFSKPGFRDRVNSDITVQVGTIGINAQLQVGVATDEVVVTTDAPLVQTEDSGQSMDFSAEAVVDAPTVGGIWYNELTNELPGVNGGGGQDASGQGIGINGTQGYSSNFLMEGSDATQPRDANASDNYPPLDAIGEVSVNSSNFGAQYGNGVAAFNVILKSGTNRFHGSAFEFIQNDAFNARNYFNRPPSRVGTLRWNEYGGSIGGPIIKDRLFFAFTYQRNPVKSSSVTTITVPTQGANGTTDMTKGCFPTSYIDSSGVSHPSIIHDSTGTAYPNNCINTPFDPVAVNLQKYFLPLVPNVPGATYSNNFTTTVASPSLSQWYVAKVDYQATKSHRLSASYVDYPIQLVTGPDAYCPEGLDCANGNNYNMDGELTDTWTINSKMANEARVGGLREVDKYIPTSLGKGYPTSLGLQPNYGPNSPGDIFPTLAVDSSGPSSGMGFNGGVHADLADGAYVESDVFTLIKGKHTIKLGGEFNSSYQNYTNWGDVSSGNFEFNGNVSGLAYADFLLGDVYGWKANEFVETGARMKMGGAFVQDDFKVTPKLVLNLGMRYQHQGGWSEANNRWGTFSPTVANTGANIPSVSTFTTVAGVKTLTAVTGAFTTGSPGAFTYGGQGGRSVIQNGANQFAPRIGFAFSPTPAMAIRGSYGIFDTPWSTDPYTNAYGVGLNPTSLSPPNNFTNGPPTFQLKNGPPGNYELFPTLASLTNSQFNNVTSVDEFPLKRPTGYYQETLLSVQRQFPGQIVMDLSYVYTRGLHQNFARDINQIPQSQLQAAGAKVLNRAAQPYPQYGAIQAHLFDGFSKYNALQVRVQKRMSHGVSFVANYAWSKTMDAGTSSGHSAGTDLWQNAYSVSSNYGLATLDTRNTINGSATYELPFGVGRQLALHGFLDQAIGGWRATGVFQVHSGIPFTPTVSESGANNSNSYGSACGCGFAWFANYLGGNPQVANPTISHFFNTAAFAVPTAGTFGNAHRGSITGPHWRDVDLSLGKTFPLIEGIKLEVRADSFNVFNHPNFAQPNRSIGSSSAGTITSANGARTVQLGGRFTF